MTVLFLTYTNRSGSTYLANILSSSKDICVCPEGDILVSLFLEDPGKKFHLTETTRESISNVFVTDHKLFLWSLKQEVFGFLERAEDNLEAFFAILEYYKKYHKPEASHVLFKAERLSALMEKISKAAYSHNQKIQFLSIIRDPRAVFASQKTTCLPGSDKFMAENPVSATWNWKKNSIQEIKYEDGLHIILKYESFIRKPDQMLERISAFTSLNLSRCKGINGDLASRLTEDERKIHSRIMDSPDTGRIYAWKSLLSPREIYLVEKTGNPIMRKIGYVESGLKFRPELEIIKVFSILGIYLTRLTQKFIFRLKPKKIRT